MRAKPIFTLGAMAGVLALPAAVHALGLGKLTVDSALGQRFTQRRRLGAARNEDKDAFRIDILGALNEG